jgi:hypothetical protein
MKAELARIARPPRPSRTGDLGSPPRQLWLAGLGLDRSHARDVERRFEALVPHTSAAQSAGTSEMTADLGVGAEASE